LVFLGLTAVGCGEAESVPAGEWRQKLARGGWDRPTLTAIVVDAIEDLVPASEPKIVGDHIVVTLGDNEMQFYLDNLWREVQQEGVDAKAVVEAYVTSLSTSGEKAEIDPKSLLPVVRPRDYAAQARADGAVFPSRPWVGELMVLVAEDSPSQTRIHELPDLEQQGYSLDRLFELGMQNLRSRRSSVGFVGEGAVRALEVGQEIESSFLLLPELWDELANGMEGAPVAAVPARDLVFFADSASAEAVATLRAIAAEAVRESHHPISSQLMIWRKGEWRLFPRPEQGR